MKKKYIIIPITILILCIPAFSWTQLIADSFTGIDNTNLNTYNAKYVSHPGSYAMAIGSNAVKCFPSAGDFSFYYYNESTNANQTASVKSVNALNYQGVTMRYNGTDARMMLWRDNIRLRIFDLAGNTIYTINTATMSVGDVLNVTYNQSNISAYINGVYKGSYLDSNITSGYTGISIFCIDLTILIDDFQAGNLTDASGGEPPASTCTPPATTTNDWLVTCSDNCNVTGTNTVVHSLNITGSSGYFNVIDGANLTINGNLYNPRCPINVQMIGGKASYIYVNASYK